MEICIFKCFFLKENVFILILISWMFVTKGPVDWVSIGSGSDFGAK